MLGLGFSDVDDYILINMKNGEYYNQLVELKGKENVDIRRAFLNLEDVNGLDNKVNNVSASQGIWFLNFQVI